MDDAGMNAGSGEGGGLDPLRLELLELHRSVIEAQRIDYERTHGRVETNAEFLGLVLNHPQFEWIRVLSSLIASMDALEDAGAAAGEGEREALLGRLRDLLHPRGADRVFTERYWRMVEEDPEVTVPHARVWRLLESRA
jgi:hypothetical protein